MAAKTVLNYLDRDSVVHKMTGTTKLAFFLLFTFASMITYNTWVLLGCSFSCLIRIRERICTERDMCSVTCSGDMM